QKLVMDEPVRGQDLAAGKLKGAAVHVCDDATSFFDQQGAGGGVPRIERELPKPVHATGGDITEIQRGGASAAHSMRAQSDLMVVVDVRILVALVTGKAG